MRHQCISCREPQAASVIMHRKNGMNVSRMNGDKLKYCPDHWKFMMTFSPIGTTFEIELVA